MSGGPLDEFRAHVLASPTLQARLREESDLHTFVGVTVGTARAHGFDLTANDVWAAIAETRRLWNEHRMA